MKVRGTKKVSTSQSVQKKQPTSGINFSEIMTDTEDDRDREQFERQVEEIEKKGKKLSESKTVEELVEYKTMIKNFLEDAVQFGLRIEERRGYGRRGRSKVLRIVSNVDEKLIELTDMVLSQEKAQIKLLQKIGEIQGLLVSIYV